MATATSPFTAIDQIGLTAGDVWHLLDEKGPQSISQIVKEVKAPRDLVMQAIGWLAREEKIVIEESSRRRLVALRSD